MLLDTASLYYRAFYGMPETVPAPDGTPVNAIRGLLDVIARLVRARHPAGPGGLPGRGLAAGLPGRGHPRVQGAPRPPTAVEDVPPGARRADPADHPGAACGRGSPSPSSDGYEADDVIATLAARSPGSGRRGHRRPGPVPARRRRPRDPGALHRPRPGQAGRDRRGGGERQVRHPGPRRTPTSPCCAATRATACPACPASARRPPPP